MPTPSHAPPTNPLNLDTASVEALLEEFPELGLSSAEYIVEWRDQNGPLLEGGLLSDLRIATAQVVDSRSDRPPEVAPRPSVPPAPPIIESEPSASEVRVVASEDSVIAAPPPEDATPELTIIAPFVAGGRGRGWKVGLAALAVMNLALAGVVVGLRSEARQTRAPITAMSVEVKALDSRQLETRTDLDETRARLEEQAKVLASTVAVVEKTAKRQEDADREAKELSAREERDVAALTARMNRVEHRVDDQSFKLDEALSIIDLVAGRPPNPEGARTKPK